MALIGKHEVCLLYVLLRRNRGGTLIGPRQFIVMGKYNYAITTFSGDINLLTWH